jgi:hypothetical protein
MMMMMMMMMYSAGFSIKPARGYQLETYQLSQKREQSKKEKKEVHFRHYSV